MASRERQSFGGKTSRVLQVKRQMGLGFYIFRMWSDSPEPLRGEGDAKQNLRGGLRRDVSGDRPHMGIRENAVLGEMPVLPAKGQYCLLAVFLFFLFAGPCPAFQEPRPKMPPKAPLTDEEREILKNREILENLDLLKDFEKFRYFDCFAVEESADKSLEAKKPAPKTEAKKEEKKKK
jgi:hypothetical protein